MDFKRDETLPTRRLIGQDVHPTVDEHGFLAEEFCAAAPLIDSLFNRHAVLVVAPPWSGKTYFADQLYRYLSDTSEGPDRSPFGRNVHATMFEQQGQATAPPWLADWQGGTDRACWIVDALDEDARGRLKQMHWILDRIESIPDTARDRLLLLMLARENEVPEDIRSRLEKVYGKRDAGDDGKFLILRLAPVDANIAMQIVGVGNIDKVCSLIKQNRLESIAALPVVLEYLARQPVDTKHTAPQVWRGVLEDLLRDRRLEQTDTMALTPIDERFAATCRVAAALTFSGQREVDSGLGQSDAPRIEDLLPLGSTSEALRLPAKEALRSVVFQRMREYYRLAQLHVQEWFTAFALEDASLARMMPLVADDKGKPFKHYQGVLGLLHKVTQHPEVAKWIVTAHGGIPPRSDAAPWTLEDAKAVLQRLLEVAKTTPYLGTPEGLENLYAPGLGSAIAVMMSDKCRTLSQRELLIDVAQAITANETALAAQAIVLDENEENHLRYSAAILLKQVGTDAHLRQVEHLAEAASHATQYHRGMVSVLIESLHGRCLWSLVKAAQHLPERDEHVVDSTAMLEYHLQKEMTLQDARAILANIDWEHLTGLGGDNESRQRGRPAPAVTSHNLIVKALEIVAQQERPNSEDYALLLPIALDERRIDWLKLERLDLDSVFAKDTDARRNLFMVGLKRDPGAQLTGWWTWRGVLTEEDVDWLAGLCLSHARESPWLWAEVLALAYRPNVPRQKRNAIRGSVEVSVPDVLVQFDANRRKHLAQKRARKRREDKARQKQESRQYSLEEIVSDTLNNPKIHLREQMLRLGWFCFVEKRFRPNNILGEWEDLDSNLRQAVLDACESALAGCEPTPIPMSGPFPGAILYEAAVFAEVIKQSPTYEPDAEQIKKWVPAVLKAGTQNEEAVLARCLLANREVTEDILLEKIKRQMNSESGSFTAGGLPKEHWSSRLSAKAADFIRDESLNLKARGELLRLMADRVPSLVVPIAQEWSNTPPGEDESLRLKRTVGLDALLRVEPSAAIPQLMARYKTEGKTILADLSTLADRFPSEGVKPASWPTPMIEGLVDVLYDAYPPENDPQDEFVGARSVGPDDELRWLRNGLITTLFERHQPEDQEALKRLAGRYPCLGRWYKSVQAGLAAQQVVRNLVPPDRPEVTIEGRVPVKKVVRLLDQARYRLIRSNTDLQRVLLEELREIEKDAKCHLAMLYLSSSHGKKQRLHEDALQAYIQCRLRDRLPDQVLDRSTQVFIDREPLAGMNQRQDVKVQAPTLSGGHATVVIEVKWSDNKDVSSSLSDQLGDNYLLGQGLTHGIYLVGWYGHGKGKWVGSPAGGRPRKPYSIATWTVALQAQASLYGETHANIKIDPFVIDLSWD